MVSGNSKVFSEYVRPEFVGTPYDGKTFPFCGGIILLGFCESSRGVCYNFLDIILNLYQDCSDTVPACISMDFCRSAFVVHPQYCGSEISAFLRLLNASTFSGHQ
ncbi:hypothetical protein TNCV_3040601 [Trichonephila clavipes]|nr:hypothetical protein TNCV_3040601 [Trichonephila clavipes]